MAYDVPQLLKMSQAELDALFTASAAGAIPTGEPRGTAIVAPGTTYSPNIAEFISNFAWQGKVFDGEKGVLRNKILPFGLKRSLPRSTRATAGLTVRNDLRKLLVTAPASSTPRRMRQASGSAGSALATPSILEKESRSVSLS